MKVAVFEMEGFTLGKKAYYDDRLDKLEEIFKSKKTTSLQIEFVPLQDIRHAEAVLTRADKKLDLVLSDLEYVQDRMVKEISVQEKELFSKANAILEKEEILFEHLNSEEIKALKAFPLLSVFPVYLLQEGEDIESDEVLKKIYYLSGRILFFTGGEKESRMWSIRKGETAVDAAGCIHSDIRDGFIRAEVISCEELFKIGHYNQAKNDGKVRLEEKGYVVQDGDCMLFRANK